MSERVKPLTEEERERADRRMVRNAVIALAVVEAVVTAAVLLYKYLG